MLQIWQAFSPQTKQSRFRFKAMIEPLQYVRSIGQEIHTACRCCLHQPVALHSHQKHPMKLSVMVTSRHVFASWTVVLRHEACRRLGICYWLVNISVSASPVSLRIGGSLQVVQASNLGQPSLPLTPNRGHKQLLQQTSFRVTCQRANTSMTLKESSNAVSEGN